MQELQRPTAYGVAGTGGLSETMLMAVAELMWCLNLRMRRVGWKGGFVALAEGDVRVGRSCNALGTQSQIDGVAVSVSMRSHSEPRNAPGSCSELSPLLALSPRA